MGLKAVSEMDGNGLIYSLQFIFVVRNSLIFFLFFFCNFFFGFTIA